MTHEKVLQTCYLLFLGAMDTVTNVTGFAWRYLAGDPELQERLAGDFSLIPGFVEEALRMFTVSACRASSRRTRPGSGCSSGRVRWSSAR